MGLTLAQAHMTNARSPFHPTLSLHSSPPLFSFTSVALLASSGVIDWRRSVPGSLSFVPRVLSAPGLFTSTV